MTTTPNQPEPESGLFNIEQTPIDPNNTEFVECLITPDQYQHLAQRTECDHGLALYRINENRDLAVRLMHSVFGMMGELGELATALEHWLWYGKPFDRVNFIEELGDTNWYQAEALNALKARLETVLVTNIEKLRKRYPHKFTPENATNRDLNAERQAMEQAITNPKGFSDSYDFGPEAQAPKDSKPREVHDDFEVGGDDLPKDEEN
jgi:NTP pyrophosphatase (non-canonical NTP hydrolase)